MKNTDYENKKIRSLSIYVDDVKTFEEASATVRSLWFKYYGENLSKSESIIKSLCRTRDLLLGERFREGRHKDDFIQRKYARTGK